MKTPRSFAKILTAVLLVSLLFTFASCAFFGGSLKLESFTVDRSSVKTVYLVGEEIDFSGIKATAVYSDESLTKVYTYDELDITYDPDITATTGNKLVTVSFMDPNLNVKQETTVQIKVNEDPNAPKHSGYAVDSSAMKLTYFVGDTIDFTGVKVYEKFTNGGADVEMTDLTKIAYDYADNITATPGSKNIVVTYGGESAGVISITVKYPAVTGVVLDTDSVKKEYMAGETLDLTGLSVTITYENGETETVTEFTAGSVDMATAGEKNVSVSFVDPISAIAMSESFKVKVDGVVDYLISTDTVKLDYLIGDTVSLDGLTVSEDWYFADNKEIAFADLSFDFDQTITSSAGSKVINIIYGGKTIGRFNIEVAIPNITNISLSGVSLEYNVGDSVSLAGLNALITYENGITRTVTDFTVVTDISTITNTPGDKSIVVKFTDPISGNSAEKSLTVKVEGVTDYKLDTSGMTLEYLEGDAVSFSGIKVVAIYYYAGEQEVAFDDLTFVHADNLTATAGNKTVTVKVGAKEVGKFIVKVGDIPTASVDISNLDLSYRVGETVSLDGLTINLVYSDGTPSEVVASGIEIVTDISAITVSAGTKTIVVKYLFDGEVELQASFDITVHGFVYQITPPTKIEYIAGDELNYAGFKVEKVYTDGGENVAVSDYVIDDTNVTATAGEKQVPVSVNGIAIGYVSFKVIPNSVKSEAISGNPTSARVNGTLDFSGLTLTVTYLNGDVITLDYSKLSVSSIDLSTAGNKTVDISYYDDVNKVNESTSFNITVYGVDSYTINTENVKTSYIAGDTVDYTGIVIHANYKDGGEPVVVDLANVTYDVSGVVNTIGTATVHVSLNGSVIGSFNLEVEKNSIVSSAVGGTFDTSYEVGDTVDFTGLTVTVTYKNGKVVVLTLDELTLGSADTAAAGTKTVNVSFTDEVNSEEASTSFEINVIEKKATVTQFEKPGSLTSFESDNKNAGTLNYGQTGFSGQFLNGGLTYVIGDDNEFRLNPLFSVLDNGSIKSLQYYYTVVDIYLHDGNDYVLLEKVADSAKPTEVSYYNGDTLFAVVDTYNGLYSFKTTAEKIKISVLPSEEYYVLNNNNPVVLEAKVIDAYNVYEAWQLAVIDNDTSRTDWNEFKNDKGILNVNPAGIVLHNDISVLVSDAPESFFDASTREVKYYNNTTGETKTYPAGTKYFKDGTTLYSRQGSGDFVIQGNFFNINLKDFPVVPSNGVFDESLDLGYGADFSNAVFIQFEYGDDNWLDKPADIPVVTIENISLIGNASQDYWQEESDGGLLTAGGLILVKSSRYADVTLNNVLNNSFFISYFPDYSGNMTVNNSKCYDSYQNAAFVWSDSTLTVNNSYINGSGGPIVISMSVTDDNDVQHNPTTVFDNTVTYSALTGQEIWFKAVNASSIVANIQLLGTNLQSAGLGNFVSKDGTMNIEAVLMPEASSADAAATEIGIQGAMDVNGHLVSRWFEGDKADALWSTIYNHQTPVFDGSGNIVGAVNTLSQGAPFLTVYDASGTAYTLFTDGTNLYDLNFNVFSMESVQTNANNHYMYYLAFTGADQITLSQGGLSVVFEFYH